MLRPDDVERIDRDAASAKARRHGLRGRRNSQVACQSYNRSSRQRQSTSRRLNIIHLWEVGESPPTTVAYLDDSHGMSHPTTFKDNDEGESEIEDVNEENGELDCSGDDLTPVRTVRCSFSGCARSGLL
jgi:hypothetical protein